GSARAVRGGFRVSGRWAHGAGVDECAWLAASGVVQRAGSLELRVLILPRADVRVADDGWRTGGLRDGGSAEFAAADVFVPEERSFAAVDPRPMQPGALYRLPLATAFALAGAAVPLGIARGAIEACVALGGNLPQ